MTWYATIGPVPLAVGATQRTVAEPSPAPAVTPVGGAGVGVVAAAKVGVVSRPTDTTAVTAAAAAQRLGPANADRPRRAGSLQSRMVPETVTL